MINFTLYTFTHKSIYILTSSNDNFLCTNNSLVETNNLSTSIIFMMIIHDRFSTFPLIKYREVTLFLYLLQQNGLIETCRQGV